MSDEQVVKDEQDSEENVVDINAKEDGDGEKTSSAEKAEPEVVLSDEEKELLELKEFKQKYYYLAAEFENLKKRHQRDRDSWLKYGNEKVLSPLIEVVDNIERTLDAVKDETDDKVVNIKTGIDMVLNQFVGVLKDNGLTQVESLGKIFDPNFHEAMAAQPAEGKKDQEIIQEFQKGYLLNGRLLRAAKVIVAKN